MGLPAIQYWFGGAAIFVAGGFALSAIVGFVGVADEMKTHPRIMISAYVLALGLFFVGWWQTAREGEQADANAHQIETY